MLFSCGYCLIEEWSFSCDYSLSELECYLQLIAWFRSKGADTHLRQQNAIKPESGKHGCNTDFTNQRPGRTAAHFIATNIGNCLSDIWTCCRDDEIENDNKLLKLDEKVFMDIVGDESQDACNCACLFTGCRTISMLLKSMTIQARYFHRHLVLPLWFLPKHIMVRNLATLLEPNESIYSSISAEIIRFMTFEELGLRHTCCWWQFDHEPAFEQFYELDPEEILELREEDHDLLVKLEELLVEFEAKKVELGVSTADFLEGYWRTRMDEVLKETGGLDEEGLRRIGVMVHEDGSESGNRVHEVDSESEDE